MWITVFCSRGWLADSEFDSVYLSQQDVLYWHESLERRDAQVFPTFDQYKFFRND